MSAKPEFFSVTVSHKSPGGFAGQGAAPTVIWLTGEHDVSNASKLSRVIAETISLDDEDVVVDMAGVTFMGGATIAVLIRANDFLAARSRSLILRAPARNVVRLLGLCGLTHLISPAPQDSVEMMQPSDALRSWVYVPTEERARRRKIDAPPPVPARIDVSKAATRATEREDAERPEAKGR